MENPLQGQCGQGTVGSGILSTGEASPVQEPLAVPVSYSQAVLAACVRSHEALTLWVYPDPPGAVADHKMAVAHV